MSNEELKGLLTRLHGELGSAKGLDEESRRLLGVVVADIERMGLGQAAGARPAGGMATPGGLESLAVRFEADHPATAAVLRQVADVLGKAGI
jgi:hypothetical protein